MNKISVVTVTYNCENVVENTIKSVIEQSYHNLEYIVIDGASKDGTMSIINRYRASINYVISEPDKGIYDAMNKALKVATGDWIIFMNAGDVFADNNVLSSIFANKDYEGFAAIYGRCNRKYEDSIIPGVKPIPFFEQKRFCKSMGFSHQAVFVNKNTLGDTMFDTSYRIAADFNMFYSLYKNGGKFQYVDIAICNMDYADGLSANNREKQRIEAAKVAGYDKTITFLIWNKWRVMVEQVKGLIGRK